MEIVERAGADNVGLLVDTWHHFAGGSKPEELLGPGSDKIFTVHIGDAPDKAPLTLRRNECIWPGDGAVPIPEMLRNLKKVGYDGIVSVEIFDPGVQAMDPGLCIPLAYRRTAQAMKEGVDLLEEALGEEVFRKYVHILLTDRGAEFSAADAMETGADGSRRTRVFYCDPMQSGQKGSLENKHVELRYILPKATDLKGLGLVDQDALNLAVSHVDSAPVEKLGGRSPLDVANFMYPELYEKLVEFGIRNIEKDKVILKSYLLKSLRK
jgi:hypothetical protein